MVLNSQTDAEWPRKRPTTMRMPSSQEDLGGKYLTDQPGESWVTLKAPRLLDIQLGIGHEGDEQSVAGQAV